MGKSPAVPKTTPKAKVANKAKAKAKAKAASQSVQLVDDAYEVSRADVSKFITALKYKAKNPKDPQSHGAQMVLEEWD